jgi:outer membrane receptor protein involved in Fe transport
VRTPFGAAVLLAFIAGLVSPVSAVASPTVVAQAAVAQSTITGHVTDSRGNPLSGAAVSIEGGGKTYTLTTASDGSFQQSVPPGLYTVTANRGGFQTAQSDVATTAGGRLDVTVAMQESNLSSLRVIGRASVSSTRTPFDVTESPISTLPPLEISLRQNNNLTDTVGILPGVVVERTFSATPNTNFVVRGAPLQTRVTIDGHPVSSGISGQWNTNYAAAGIFQDVEVVKGAGLNGALAGESAVGTVNLRTRDFTRNNSAGVELGGDNYSGGIYNAFADVNFLDNRASLLVQKAFVGYNGPWNNLFNNRSGAISSAPIGVGAVPVINGLDQWQGDFSNRYSLQAELAKLRYRFSESSSVTLEYLGLQGQYQPQGGSYAAYTGQMTLQACQNGSAFSPTLAGCTASSTYTAPYTLPIVGASVNAYTWFPNSFIQNNEPQFAAEFRTSLKNDTLLFRPYTHLINRYISGADENLYPGNNGGWYAVTSAANCQVTFVNPTAAGAKGPCFPVTMSPNSPAYIGNDPTSHGFATTATAPTCSPTPPYTCFTTKTGVQNNGVTNYGTPFSQPELDRLNGYTFNWIHPVGDNIYNFSYDYRKDFSQSQSGDQTPAAAGCNFTIGSAATTIANPGSPLGAVGALYQPTCSLPGFLPRSAIGTPPTVSQYGDFALTGTFALGERLKLALGNYFEIYKLNAQIEDPNLLALYAAAGSAAAAPVALVTRATNYSHYDPHLGLEYRASRDTSFRASAGSSITQPYPSLVSGFGNITIPNAANGGNYTNTIPNFNLKPETTVAYDLGMDQRLHDGGVLSFDLYDLTVHDVFLSNTTNLPTIPGICGPGNGSAFPNALCLQSNQINGPIQRSYGLEVSVSKNPVNGFGYYISETLQRTYLDQLPLSIYTANTSAGSGNFNISGAQLFGDPFFKSYAQLLYADARGDVYEVGADYEGANNYSFGPVYTIWDASVRIPIIPKKLRLQLSGQNLFNLNDGSGLARSLSGQGFIQPTVYLKNGVLLPSGSSANLNELTPQTFRLSFNYSL